MMDATRSGAPVWKGMNLHVILLAVESTRRVPIGNQPRSRVSRLYHCSNGMRECLGSHRRKSRPSSASVNSECGPIPQRAGLRTFLTAKMAHAVGRRPLSSSMASSGRVNVRFSSGERHSARSAPQPPFASSTPSERAAVDRRRTPSGQTLRPCISKTLISRRFHSVL